VNTFKKIGWALVEDDTPVMDNRSYPFSWPTGKPSPVETDLYFFGHGIHVAHHAPTHTQIHLHIHIQYAYNTSAQHTNNKTKKKKKQIGHDYAEALADFTQTFGTIPLPPRSSFGVLASGWHRWTMKDFYDRVSNYSNASMPLDGFVLGAFLSLSFFRSSPSHTNTKHSTAQPTKS